VSGDNAQHLSWPQCDCFWRASSVPVSAIFRQSHSASYQTKAAQGEGRGPLQLAGGNGSYGKPAQDIQLHPASMQTCP